MWTNFWDKYSEGNFVSVNNADLSLKTTALKENWVPSEPNGGIKENCAMVEKKSSQFVDVPCDFKGKVT